MTPVRKWTRQTASSGSKYQDAGCGNHKARLDDGYSMPTPDWATRELASAPNKMMVRLQGGCFVGDGDPVTCPGDMEWSRPLDWMTIVEHSRRQNQANIEEKNGATSPRSRPRARMPRIRWSGGELGAGLEISIYI